MKSKKRPPTVRASQSLDRDTVRFVARFLVMVAKDGKHDLRSTLSRAAYENAASRAQEEIEISIQNGLQSLRRGTMDVNKRTYSK